MERTIKVVLISTGSKRGYSYSAWRVVECLPHQRGYKNERGVKVLWESEDLYRPNAKRSDSKGHKAWVEATRIAEQARQALVLPLPTI